MTDRDYSMDLTIREYRAHTARLDAMSHGELLLLIEKMPKVVWDRSVPLDEVWLLCDTYDGKQATLVYKMPPLLDSKPPNT